MKCACGYEYEFKIEKFEHVVVKGDEDFISVIGTFFILEEKYSSIKREINVYMCPKCGTLRGDKYV